MELVASASPDALVIDIGLPDSDGRDVCQALRARGIDAPVLFLTARDALTDRLSGFSSGGDDYVTKPFDVEEVAVRLRALIRRAGGTAPAVVAGLAFDPTELTIARGDAVQQLTPTEFRLLAALAARA
jgi:two-component system response regulator MprA